MTIIAKELVHFERTSAEDQPQTVGIFIEQPHDSERKIVHLLAVDENKGPAISDNFWRVAGDIAKRYFTNQSVDSLDWTFTTGAIPKIARLALTSFNQQPFKVDVSDNWVVRGESGRQM